MAKTKKKKKFDIEAEFQKASSERRSTERITTIIDTRAAYLLKSMCYSTDSKIKTQINRLIYKGAREKYGTKEAEDTAIREYLTELSYLKD